MITVRLNGTLTLLFGTARLSVALPDAGTVGDLLATLAEQCPDARDSLARAIPVVGGVAASSGEPLTGVPEMALLMPVSGG